MSDYETKAFVVHASGTKVFVAVPNEADPKIVLHLPGWPAISVMGQYEVKLLAEAVRHALIEKDGSLRKEVEEYRKERQEFIDRDNAMKMAAQDDAVRIAKAEARVKELETLVVTGASSFSDHVSVSLVLPMGSWPTIGGTLGEAMERKGAK
jgi:predicted methyltransferase